MALAEREDTEESWEGESGIRRQAPSLSFWNYNGYCIFITLNCYPKFLLLSEREARLGAAAAEAACIIESIFDSEACSSILKVSLGICLSLSPILCICTNMYSQERLTDFSDCRTEADIEFTQIGTLKTLLTEVHNIKYNTQ
jgi:hypothetical protein